MTELVSLILVLESDRRAAHPVVYSDSFPTTVSSSSSEFIVVERPATHSRILIYLPSIDHDGTGSSPNLLPSTACIPN